LPINIFTREETLADIASAFYWEADNGAHVISNSWGFTISCGESDPSIDAGVQAGLGGGTPLKISFQIVSPVTWITLSPSDATMSIGGGPLQLEATYFTL
jgi:hypothetical protein